MAFDIIDIKPINVKDIDSVVKKTSSRRDLYFDFIPSEFTAITYPDKSGAIKVWYSKCKGKLDDKAKEEYPNYGDKLNDLFVEATGKNNKIEEYLTDELSMNTICDIIEIPELKALCFITAGYKVGRACLEAVYGDVKANQVQYIIGQNMHTIEGGQLEMIAAKYFLHDIESSQKMGYMYFNKTGTIQSIEGKGISIAMPNMKRFGYENGNCNSTSRVMRYMEEFIPIGFSWVSYTPFWWTCESFKKAIVEHTVLGLDFFEVENLTYDGYDIHYSSDDVNKSMSFYTTRKRLYQLLGEKFDNHNYQFYNTLFAYLFLGEDGPFSIDKVYVNKNNTNDKIIGVMYKSLNEDRRAMYEQVVDNTFSRALTIEFVKKYWSTMTGKVGQESVSLIKKIESMTLDSIQIDVASQQSSSTDIFKYVD